MQTTGRLPTAELCSSAAEGSNLEPQSSPDEDETRRRKPKAQCHRVVGPPARRTQKSSAPQEALYNGEQEKRQETYGRGSHTAGTKGYVGPTSTTSSTN